MKKIILFILFIINLQAQTFIQKATYTMGDDESKITAKNKAIQIAKKACIEKAGVYVSSYSKSIKGILKKDTIESFSASIMKVVLIDENFLYPKYSVKIRADIDINLLNKKLKQFSDSNIHIEDRLEGTKEEIRQYEKQIKELLKRKHEFNELENLQKMKKVLIKRVDNLSNSKNINSQIITHDNYAYLNIKSNIENSEVYINDIYIGVAPIKHFKVESNKDIVIKASNNKIYYPKDIIIKNKFKKLSVSNIDLKFIKGKAKLFLVGEKGSTLYINHTIIKKLHDKENIVIIKAGEDINISLENENGCFVTNEDIWANQTYEIFFTLDKRKCHLLNNTFIYKNDLYKMVISPYTSRIWLDRNLGAKKVCKNFNDEACYGSYFQWGRYGDGHEEVNSPISKKIQVSHIADNRSFIVSTKEYNYNWTSETKDELWQVKDTLNNPCPKGFRVPNISELLAEVKFMEAKNAFDLYNSFLKLPIAGYRYRVDGSLNDQGISGNIWSSDTKKNYSNSLYFTKKFIKNDLSLKANGYSLRCIKKENIVDTKN